MKKNRIGRLCLWCMVIALVLSACSHPAAPSETHDSGTLGGDLPADPTGSTGDTTMEGTDVTDPTLQQPTQPAPTPDGYAVRPLRYPQDAVKTLAGRMISLGSLCARAAAETSYLGNRHYTGTNLVISPYFSASIDDAELPVYATPVYVATNSHGALHSFASVDVSFGDHSAVLVKLKVDDAVAVHSAQVFANKETAISINGRELSFQVSSHGVYTVVLNDDQDYAITVFVRTYEDEDAQIAQYKARCGEENVQVFEPGIHEIDYLLMLRDNMVIYLKAGAILLPKHTIDIIDDDAASKETEFGAKETNELGLNRYPVINGYAHDNLVIAGRGTVDMTQLDWHERRGIVFSLCNGVTMDGVIIINPCEWSFITYRCEDVTVTQSAVLGYRTNSDAFAICNSIDVKVTDCFARTGDDMFEVKTLGGVDTAVSRNITFSRCQAWGSKARCFGIIGEIEKDVSDIVFEDSIVIFRDATWDNNRIGSLVVLRECGTGNVSGVTFRNISVHHDSGRAINVGVYTRGLKEGTMENLTFENVSYNADMVSQVRRNDGKPLKITLDGVIANGSELNWLNVLWYFTCDGTEMISFR